MEDVKERSHVTFQEDGFTVKIYTGRCNPVEDWRDLIRALVWYLGHEDPELQNDGNERNSVCCLLEALLPKYEDLKKMTS